MCRVCNLGDTDNENSQGSLYKFRRYIAPQRHIHQCLQENEKHVRTKICILLWLITEQKHSNME